MNATTTDAALDAELAECFDDPVQFARGILDDDLWDFQIDLMRALDQPRARVAVKGCHNSSKTFTAAEYVLYFITHFDDGIAITTAPNARQVEDVMWGQIHSLRQKSRFPYRDHSLTRINLTPRGGGSANYALGFTTSKGDEAVRFHGFKAPHILFVLDESPGIPSEILTAIEASAAGNDVRVLLLGNPTIPSGAFYDCFQKDRTHWKCFTVDAYDTPNFELLRELAASTKDPTATLHSAMTMLLQTLPANDPAITHNPRPYLAGPLWAKEMLAMWSERSPLWQGRVRAQFPEQSESSLFSLAWLEASREDKLVDEKEPIDAGVDVAGPGKDETAVIVRQGHHIITQHSWVLPDPYGELVAFLNPFKARLRAVNVDAIGMGHHFGMRLRSDGFNVNPVNVADSSNDEERYHRLKAEYYWGLRMRFEAGDVSNLTDDLTISQLASLQYEHNARGQIEIESKDKAARRGITKSPDRAEAMMLAFARTTPGMLEYMQREHEYAQAVRDAENLGKKPPPKLGSNRLVERYQKRLAELRGDRE